MSGFGITAFRRLKEEGHAKEINTSYFQHVIVGDDYLSVLQYLNLRNKFGPESVCLVSENPITRERIIHELKCSMYPLRSGAMTELLGDVLQRFDVDALEQNVSFYKDGKLHSFEGRANSYQLQEGELAFTRPAFKWNWERFIASEDWEKIDELLHSQTNKILHSIELVEPEDLVEPKHFKIYTGELDCISCEHLYWGKDPKILSQIVEDPSQLTDEVLHYINSVKALTGVVVSFECEETIHASSGTVFLPQSATHEWGHFIAEFEAPTVNGKQVFRVLILIGEDDITSEELAKKIKLMKRVTERVFPKFAKVKYQESIRYDQQMFYEITESTKLDLEFLHLTSNAAPNGYQELNGYLPLMLQ